MTNNCYLVLFCSKIYMRRASYIFESIFVPTYAAFLFFLFSVKFTFKVRSCYASGSSNSHTLTAADEHVRKKWTDTLRSVIPEHIDQESFTSSAPPSPTLSRHAPDGGSDNEEAEEEENTAPRPPRQHKMLTRSSKSNLSLSSSEQGKGKGTKLKRSASSRSNLQRQSDSKVSLTSMLSRKSSGASDVVDVTPTKKKFKRFSFGRRSKRASAPSAAAGSASAAAGSASAAAGAATLSPTPSLTSTNSVVPQEDSREEGDGASC